MMNYRLFRLNRKLLLFFASALLFNGLIQAQFQKDSLEIMTSINHFFLGMKQQDTALMHQQMHSSLNYMRTFRKNKDGQTKIDAISTKDFLLAIVKDKSAQLEEKISRPKIFVDDVLATVWVDYEFWYNGKFSHAGVDAFTLIMVDEVWQIAAVVDTRKRPK